MILSVCPNPCVDCTIELDLLKVGGLNRIENKIITYSGKALNVAIGVSRLGGDSFATGFMFDDNGKMFVHALDDENVKNTFVWNKGSARTNYKIVDKRSMMTEINDKGDKVSPQKQAELVELVKEKAAESDIVIISGSLPRGVNDEYYYALTTAAGKAKVVVDGEKGRLAAALKAGVYMAKPNLDELEDFTGKKYKTYEEMVEGCRKIIDGGAENVMLSLGRRGAIFTDGKTSYFCKSENVAVNSTVGAGDSMVAAACVATLEGADKPEILRRAVAAGTASITMPGTNLFTKEKYLEILENLQVAKL